MQINEAKEILNEAGYLLEDKYMDDMDRELDTTVTMNTMLKELKKYGYKTSAITNSSIYVWPLANTAKYGVVIEINNVRNRDYPYDYDCFVWDREKDIAKFNWGYTVKNTNEYYQDFSESHIPCYKGPIKDICKPAEEALKKLMKPGFFKRVFGKKKVEESYKND